MGGRVVLVRRAKPPLRGRWSLPGGTVETGETLIRALIREMREETGLRVRPLEMLAVVDRIDRVAGRVRYHHVIVDYLCLPVSGRVRAGSDAEAVALVRPGALDDYRLNRTTREIIGRALRRSRSRRLASARAQGLASSRVPPSRRARRGGS